MEPSQKTLSALQRLSNTIHSLTAASCNWMVASSTLAEALEFLEDKKTPLQEFAELTWADNDEVDVE